jgi:predicted  nucleic acid-binding Zn-ribbon protein
MLALAEYRAARCSGCGGDLMETTRHDKWNPVPPLQCHKCEAIAVQQDTYGKDYKHLHTFRWGANRG